MKRPRDELLTGQHARRGASIRLFLVDGSPDGLRLVEKSNWSGVGIVCSRSEYLTARKRPEYAHPGIYLLVGPPISGALQDRVYIGEADELKGRIDSQVKAKDFWTLAVAFTSKDAYLNKAHVRYLESRLIALAMQAKRADLDNGTIPPLPHLSEADQAEIETFLDEMLVVLPLVGVSAFEIPAESSSTTPSERLFLKGKGEVEAVGSDRPEGFVVFKGAKARTASVPSIHAFLRGIRDDLIKAGVLQADGQQLLLTKTHIFESPSTAAGVLLGRSANGRIEWKNAEGRTLKEIQEAAV